VDDSKVEVLQEMVADRWDTGMMLGGSDRVTNLIYKHISSNNEELQRCINEWLGFLKWHREFDWDEITENLLFGCRHHQFPDVFWENEEYVVPGSYVPIIVWTSEKPNVASNIREAVAEMDGFEDLKASLAEEANKESEECKAEAEGAGLPASEIKADGQSTGESSSCNTFDSSGDNVGFRPDVPYKGANKIAFESYFMKHTLRKKTVPVDQKAGSPRKPVKLKPNVSLKQQRQSRKIKKTWKKKVVKKRRSSKTKSVMNRIKRRQLKNKKKKWRRRRRQ